MKMRRATSIFLVCIATAIPLASSAGTDNPLANRSKSVGVVVLAGYSVELFRLAAMVMWNKRETIPVTDSRLSDAIFNNTREQLLKEDRFEKVSRVELPFSMVREIQDKYPMSKWPKLVDAFPNLSEAVRNCDCDSVLVIAPSSRDMYPTNQVLRGFQWTAESGFGPEVRISSVSLALTAYLVDPMTLKVAAETVFTGDAKDTAEERRSFILESKHWPSDMRQLDEGTWDIIMPIFEKSVRLNTRRTLHVLGLRPSCTERYWQLHKLPQTSATSTGTVEYATNPLGVSAALCQ
jgi:hypothetical protein